MIKGLQEVTEVVRQAKKDLEAKRFQNLFHGRSSTDASLKRPV